MPAMQERLWTAAEVQQLPHVRGWQFEVIDGELFVTPAPVLAHQVIMFELTKRLDTYLRIERVGIVVAGPFDVDPGTHTLVQPDALVIPGKFRGLPRDFADAGRLILAIEVLSPHSIRRDRVVKRNLYARMKAEYWIVDHEARTIERCVPGRVDSEFVSGQLEWLPEGAKSPLLLDLPEFFAEALNERG